MHIYEDDMSHAKSRLRTPSAKNIKEDLELLESGIMDYNSFLSGYRYHNHPVDVKVHNAEGELKAIRRSHNLRTDRGGHDQALNMSSATVPTAQYMSLSNTTFTPSSADTVLNGELTTNGLNRALGTFAFVSDPTNPVVTQTSTVQAAYKLTASWTLTASTSNIVACGVFNAASGGDLWFEATFGAINTNTGDTIQLSYTINF